MFAPAVISRAMIVPHRSLKRASEISGMRDPIRKGMLPGINAPGSPVACCRSSPVFKPCRALPVAHPGCPVDHIQTLVNQSPGDLWMRCIGNTHFVFCYLALGEGVNPPVKLLKERIGEIITGWSWSFHQSFTGKPSGFRRKKFPVLKYNFPAHNNRCGKK